MQPNPSTPSPTGRPRALDDAKRREICALVSAGCAIKDAARYVRCSINTIHRERKTNPEFAEQLHRAELSAQLHPLHAMQQASRTHWRAAAWMLERTHPEQFGRQNQPTFGPLHAQALVNDVQAIIRDEVLEPFTSARLEARVAAAIRYAVLSTWKTQHSGKQLCQALRFLAQKEIRRSDALVDSILGSGSPLTSPPYKPHKTATQTNPVSAAKRSQPSRPSRRSALAATRP